MIKLIHGDALQEIKNIDKKVNCIIADIPQGITKNELDIPFNLKELWQSIDRSGTTGVACKNLNRNFIGIDKSLEAFNIAKNRLEVI